MGTKTQVVQLMDRQHLGFLFRVWLKVLWFGECRMVCVPEEFVIDGETVANGERRIVFEQSSV